MKGREIQPETDATSWQRIRAANPQAFEAFYRENAARLLGFLRLLTGSAHSAEDVMQETFAEIWRSPHGYEPERGSLRAYLFGIGRKRAADWRRKHGSSGTPAMVSEPVAAGKTELVSAITDAFKRLDTDQQSLLWLREVEGQSYADLAQILEIPVGTVRSRLFAAREELRRIWHSQPQKVSAKQ